MADYLHNLKPNDEEIDYNEAKQIKNRVSSPEEAKQLIRNQDPPSPPPLQKVRQHRGHKLQNLLHQIKRQVLRFRSYIYSFFKKCNDNTKKITVLQYRFK